MQRVQRLRELWSWLPAFRVAAETEHLPTAAERLHVTASSISRAIRLLEDSLGQKLFDRDGRSLRLNRQGSVLLASLRDAMRLLDDTVAEVSGEGMRGFVDLSMPPDYSLLMGLPAMAELSHRHEQLRPRLRHLPAGELDGALLGGRVDVAVVDQIIVHDDLQIERLAVLPQSVFGTALASPGASPKASRRFVAVAGDSWPAHKPRTVVLDVHTLTEAAALCKMGDVCAVLPDVIAAQHGLTKTMSGTKIEARAIYALYRRPVGEHPRTEAALEALRRAAEMIAD